MLGFSEKRLRTGLGAMFVGAIALLVVACGGDGPTSTAVPAPTAIVASISDGDAMSDTVKVKLVALNDSGQDGTATLKAQGNQTEVVIEVASGAAGVAQPVHIHAGTCDTLGGVDFPLTNIVDGKSTTTVDATLELLFDHDHAINGHKSADEIEVYISCGNIKRDDAMMMEDGDSAQSVEITSAIRGFTLENLTVKTGSTIVWRNLDGPTHTSTSGVSPSPDGKWDTGILGQNQSAAAITLNEVGAFAYFCQTHPWMQATVTVVS